MKYGADGRRGRGMLIALLCLNLFLSAAGSGLYAWDLFTPATIALLALALLPNAVVLWSIYRGSFPAMALFCVFTILQVGDLIGALQFGGVESLNRATALAFLTLLARITVLLALWRHDGVASYWAQRQTSRRRRDLVVEIVLLAVTVLLVMVLPFLVYSSL